MFALAQLSSAESCAALVEMSIASDIDDIFLGSYQREILYEVLDSPIGGAPVQPNVLRVINVVHQPSQRVLVRENGDTVREDTAPLPLTVVRAHNFLGKTLYSGCPVLAGRMSELLVYARALDDRALLGLEAYLAARARLASRPWLATSLLDHSLLAEHPSAPRSCKGANTP